MSRKTPWTLISALVALSLLLAACGHPSTAEQEVPSGQPTSTPLSGVTPMGKPANSTTVMIDDPHWCGSVKYDQDIECRGNIAKIVLNDNYVIYSEIFASPNPHVDGTDTQLTLDVQLNDTQKNYYDHLSCLYDGNGYANPTVKSGIGPLYKTTRHTISCSYENKDVVSGTLFYFFGSELAAEFEALATATPLVTETPLATNAAMLTTSATATALTVDSSNIEFGEKRETIGTDSDSAQLSIILWKQNEKGIALSSSSKKVGFGHGSSGLTGITYLTPDKAYNQCVVRNPGFGKVTISPCYTYEIPANTKSVTAPGVNPTNAEWYAHDHVSGGPECYQPRETKSTATATGTPVPTSTWTPTATQRPTLVPADMTVSTTAKICNHTYIQVVGASSISCSENPDGADLLAYFYYGESQAGLVWGDKTYMSLDADPAFICTWQGNARKNSAGFHGLARNDEVTGTCSNGIVITLMHEKDI